MCLAIPARIIEINGFTAKVDMAGNRRNADIALLDSVSVGDYILIHAGFAIHRLDPLEAEETLKLFNGGNSQENSTDEHNDTS